eukprot:1195915-Prorocentrum_minimum.AAC.2
MPSTLLRLVPPPVVIIAEYPPAIGSPPMVYAEYPPAIGPPPRGNNCRIPSCEYPPAIGSPRRGICRVRDNDMRVVAELWKLSADANVPNLEGESPAVAATKCMSERNAGALRRGPIAEGYSTYTPGGGKYYFILRVLLCQ